jgi:hypothetical protein
MAFLNNGIIIQDTNRESLNFTHLEYFADEGYKNYRAYLGLGRYYLPWPLQLENDTLSKQLTAEIEKWFDIDIIHNPPENDFDIVPERKICTRYVQHCRSKGIRIRTLFCRSELEKPLWDSPLPKINILGYDYCTGVPYYSTIPDDLLDPVTEYLDHSLYKELLQCGEKLNSNKLYDNENDIRTYIEKRKEVMESDIQLSKRIDNGKEYQVHLIDPWVGPSIVQLAEVIGDLESDNPNNNNID